MNENLIKYAVCTVGGLILGYSMGYLVTTKRLDNKLQQEIDEVKAHYDAKEASLKLIRKDGDLSTVGSAARFLREEAEEKAVDEIISDNDYAVSDVPENHNIWNDAKKHEADAEASSEIEEVHEEESEVEIVRSSDKPYIISIEEYMTDSDDDDEYTKLTFGYYEEDGVLTDEKDSIVPDVDGIVGIQNLSHFGHLSNDDNILYVRNERKKIDIEIVRDEGSYTKIILGKDFPDEPKKRNKKSMED